MTPKTLIYKNMYPECKLFINKYPCRYSVYNFGIVLGMSGIGILIIFGMIIYSNSPIFGLPRVQVSPTCGPPDPGFSIVINANGFAPNSNVNWKLVNSKAEIPLYGYFQTNITGGFNDVTFADDLKADSVQNVLRY